MKSPILWTVSCLLLLAASAASAQPVQSTLIWSADAIKLEVRFDAKAAPDLKDVTCSLLLFDTEGKRVWNANPTPALGSGNTAALVQVELPKLEKPKAAHHLELTIASAALGIEHFEQIHFSTPDLVVPSYGFCRDGTFPDVKVTTWIALKAAAGEVDAPTQWTVTVRDREGNVALDKVVKLPSARQATRHQLEITPASDFAGPYTLEYKVENDPLGWYFEAAPHLALANALVPVSSFELDDRTWSASPGDRPVPTPVLTYDEQSPHSGRRALRIDYKTAGAVRVFSGRVLPGLPLVARLWVKGNNSADRLHIGWHDHYDTTRPVWNRFPNIEDQVVCTLNFEGWRSFRVPVMGVGLQRRSPAGSTEAIDAPIYAAYLEVQPARAAKNEKLPPERTVWVDDLSVETQTNMDQRLSIELRADTTDRTLHKDARVYAAIGNGHLKNIDDGKLRLVAKDRAGQVIQQSAVDLTLAAGNWQVLDLPLKEAFEKSPLGPVDVDISFVAPALAGLRGADRITLKSPRSSGLLWDFELPQSFTQLPVDRRNKQPQDVVFQKLPVAQTAPGGAEGSAQCLRLIAGPAEQPNSAILNPSLPGVVDRIYVMVKGSGAAVQLQPILLDNGLTGDTAKNCNVFYLPPITVDWTDWRKVELIAPVVPAHYEDNTRYFVNQPDYPLNLAFAASSESPSAEVCLDNVRIRTHLLPEDELLWDLPLPDDTGIYAPGSPLLLAMVNLAAADRKLALAWRLESYQSTSAEEGKVELAVPAGQRMVHRLLPSLKPGMYTLTLTGLGAQPSVHCIQVLDATRYFGPKPAEFLLSMPEIRKTLGMTTEPIHLDWDNTEPVPGLFHYNWFNAEAKKASADGTYTLVPVVGFSADWAGPHQQESIARGQYQRFMGNILQLPVRTADWSTFVRTVAREYKGRFARWAFWENPDLESAPQGIPAARYPELLGEFSKWIRLYDPKAKIVACGFNMDRVLNYLESIPKAASLPFDEISVQMNLGELSPEQADMEGLLDELNDVLQAATTGKKVQLTETDWPVGSFVSPGQQAAYHARATLILNSRGAYPHRFNFTNGGYQFPGPGIFYHLSYGNSQCVQDLKPVFAPKPAYFALRQLQDFLSQWKFVKSVTVPDLDSQLNRAFLYQNAEGRIAAVIWRVGNVARLYKLPASWRGAVATDAFGFDVSLSAVANFTFLPTLIQLPQGYTLAQAASDLRLLQPADGKDRLLLDLHLAEADSCQQAAYSATGASKPQERYGRIPGDRKLRETFVYGLESEHFQFTLDKAGDAVLTRLWILEDTGQKLTVQLNDSPAQPWDLSLPKPDPKYTGIREATFVLRNCVAGKNTIRIAYAKPGNCAGYRVEPLAEDHVLLSRCGPLNALQTKGEIQKYRSVSGTALAIGKTRYETGLGSHAVALIEYPLNGQFSSFEVTVGVDAATDGRGSVSFEIHVDGARKADSGLLNGFSKPVTLKVDGLESAQRLALIVKDAGDKNQDDLADWVDGRLYLRK